MLRKLGAYILSVALSGALVLVSGNAFMQVMPNLRDQEPGSLLFGVLHLVIGTSAGAAAIGVLIRARWAAWCIGGCGLAAVGLLGLQPLYEPMTRDERQAVWLGAAVAGAVALGIAWSARRLAIGAAIHRAVANPAPVVLPAGVPLPDAPWPVGDVEPIGIRTSVAGPGATIPRGGESRAGD